MQQPRASLVAANELVQPPVTPVMPMKEAFILKFEEAHSLGVEDLVYSQQWVNRDNDKGKGERKNTAPDWMEPREWKKTRGA